MSLRDEIETYGRVKVSTDTCEIETWDTIIFPKVIRKRETELIISQVEKVKPKRILDFGCGPGWLSKLFSSIGYSVVGIDASSSLIRSASKSSSELSRFIVGDCTTLPFKDNAFDFIIGISIFHHLEAEAAFHECHRVSTDSATLFLMEPNKLNPLAALGRKITNVQTESEKPFYPRRLVNTIAKTGWTIREIRYLFPYSFGLSYISKLVGNKQAVNNLCTPIELSERLLERVPCLNQLCWTIVIRATKQ